MDWSPVFCSVHIRTYAFGERLIPEMLAKTGVPAEGRVSETWEISDQKDARATITRGPYAGRLLNDLVREHPDELVGRGYTGPHFPILDKFLDASHMLPVHLHADDETAARLHGEPNGKTEAWHILWCAPGTTILTGIKPGMSDAELRAAFKDEDYRRVMFEWPLQPGDTVYVPGCILHSFGPGTLIFEVQQTSDLGQNVMPVDIWGNRLDEATWDENITKTLAELKQHYVPKPNPGLARAADGSGNRLVVGAASKHFAIERWTLADTHVEPSHPERCVTLSNVGAAVTLRWSGGECVLERAESCILPAAIGQVEITPGAEGGDLIVCYVPHLERDIVEPLRAAGHSDAAIAALGEVFQ